MSRVVGTTDERVDRPTDVASSLLGPTLHEIRRGALREVVDAVVDPLLETADLRRDGHVAHRAVGLGTEELDLLGVGRILLEVDLLALDDAVGVLLAVGGLLATALVSLLLPLLAEALDLELFVLCRRLLLLLNQRARPDWSRRLLPVLVSLHEQ